MSLTLGALLLSWVLVMLLWCADLAYHQRWMRVMSQLSPRQYWYMQGRGRWYRWRVLLFRRVRNRP